MNSSEMAPLDGVTVVEIDNWMAAPSAGAILADLGATVIKVEPLTGDPMRQKGRPPKFPEPPDNVDALKSYDWQFDVDNRGKQSILVALDKPEGQALLHKLVASADIFMCNLLRRRQEKFRLDPDSLFAVRKNLVHATLTGYGTDGREAQRPGYDVTAFFGRSGLYDAMRDGSDGVGPDGAACAGRPHCRACPGWCDSGGTPPCGKNRRRPGRRDLAVRNGDLDTGV